VKRLAWPLSLTCVLIAVGGGLLSLSSTGALGVVRFFALPESLHRSHLIETAQRDFLASLGLIGFVFLLITGLATWLSARAVSGDVHFVRRRIYAMAKLGDLGEPIAIRTLDEVGELTRAFEQLRESYLEQLLRERAAHRQAQDADRYKSEFLTTVSHELRTPLNAILGFTEVLLAEIEGPLSEGQREDLRMIRASGEHLLSLFNNVLDFSALATGRLHLQLESVDVGAVLHEVASLLEGQRQGKPVAIVVDVQEFLPDVEADPTRLRQIVMNLGTNALKFTPQGEVRLAAALDHGRVRVSVRDTGIGIAEGDIPLLFEEFSQVGSADYARPGSSGLGLSIVRQLVSLHGGQVQVRSEQGRGSTFSFSLPLYDEGEID